MKTIKHNLLAVLLLSVSVVFAQVKTQKSTESFNVKSDVIVEINAHDSDIIVEHWNKNQVLVETVLSIDGVTVEESKEFFDGWNVEALGNSTRVVINSRPDFHYAFAANFDFEMPNMDFEMPDIDFDFEPVIAYGFNFDSVSFPTPPKMPTIVIEHLNKIEWDQKAYEKNKKKYLEKFEAQQEAWAKEFEEKFEPQMEKYEAEMEKWAEDFEKNIEPQLKKHEAKMEKWEKEFEKNIEPKLKAQEKKMEKLEEEIEAKLEKSMKMKKKITIKIPKDARVKVNTHDGSIKLPKGVKRV
ncbi:MAG: hypothetical protein QM478_07155 [Flavobacteriaceae bacterium]